MEQSLLALNVPLPAADLDVASHDILCCQHLPDILPVILLMQADCPFVDHLGAGACASVNRHRMEFAVKRLKSTAEAEWLRNEAEIMACLQHPNIVRPLGWVWPQDDGHWGLAMPYENGGNLNNFIRSVAPSISLQLNCHGVQ